MPMLLSLYDLFSEFGTFLSVADILLPVGLFPGGYTVILLILPVYVRMTLNSVNPRAYASKFIRPILRIWGILLDAYYLDLL